MMKPETLYLLLALILLVLIGILVLLGAILLALPSMAGPVIVVPMTPEIFVMMC